MPDEFFKFDMGRMCEYCFVIIIGVIVLLIGNMLMEQEPGNSMSVVGISLLIAGIGIIVSAIIIAIINHFRHTRKS